MSKYGLRIYNKNKDITFDSDWLPFGIYTTFVTGTKSRQIPMFGITPKNSYPMILGIDPNQSIGTDYSYNSIPDISIENDYINITCSSINSVSVIVAICRQDGFQDYN